MNEDVMKKLFVKIAAVIVLLTVISASTRADVTLDGTMGTAGSITGPVYDIQADYGQQAGVNLFHSFSAFNVNTGETANFGVGSDVQNIISRVSSGACSWIDGVLRSTLSGTSTPSGASLYLLNPGGVIFGPHASLDLGGSFYVSTGDYLALGQFDRFYAERDNAVLSTAPPTAFGFLDGQIGSISFQGAGHVEDNRPMGLTVSEGKTISVIGGNLEMTGAYYQPSPDIPAEPLGNLNAPQGRITLASAASPGQVRLGDSGPDISSLDQWGTIRLSDHSLVKTSGEGSGDIYIRAGQFFAENYSSIEADSLGNQNGGITDIQADVLSLNHSNIFSDTLGTGTGGAIAIRAGESVTVADSGRIFADAAGEGASTGSAGAVSIETPRLVLNNGGIVSSETYGRSQGGNVSLRAGEIDMSGGAWIFSRSTGQSTDGPAGNAGTVSIETNHISLTNESVISSETFEQGQGGSVVISGPNSGFAEAVRVSDSGIYATTGGSGGGGSILLKAEGIELDTTAYISSASESTGAGGDAGKVEIIASHSVRLQTGSSIITATAGQGMAGDITVQTGGFELSGGSAVSSESTLPSDTGGDAGTIVLDTRDLTLTSGSAVTTEAEGGGGGRIFVTADNQLYLLNSNITSSVNQGIGQGGDVTVGALSSQDQKQAAQFVILNHSGITANADFGDGGAIFIVTENYLKSLDSQVTATSRRGNDGTVKVEAPELDMTSGLIALPGSYLDAGQWAAKPCSARAGEETSRFVIDGRDGVGMALDDWIPGSSEWREQREEERGK
jgi:filamentous hemagglutinin family protein